MQQLSQTVFNTISSHKLIQKDQTVIVASSGGPDSTALLCLLMLLVPENIKAAAYINHNLRADETEKEADHVKSLCKIFGIDFIYESIPVNIEKKKTGESIEQCSRRLRYNALEKQRVSTGTDLIAVGHTLDDQAEELLIRLIRGTGLKGLSGMTPINNRIIRPLLNSSKQNILNYLETNNISYCQDSSNLSLTFLRNRVRLELIPMLEKIFNPSIKQNLRNTTDILRDDEKYLDTETIRFYNNLVNVKKIKNITSSIELSYQIDLFLALHPSIKRRVLEKMCWKAASKPSFKAINDILGLTGSGRTGAELHLPNGLKIIKTAEKIIFQPRQHRHLLQQRANNTLKVTHTFQSPGQCYIEQLGKTLSITEVTEYTRKPESSTLIIDAALVSFPIILRTAEPGETFTPLGAPGKKKVFRFLSDKKIPKHLRPSFPLLISANKVIAIAGLAIDNQVKITNRSSRYLEIDWS